jgi:hypothetical protein
MTTKLDKEGLTGGRSVSSLRGRIKIRRITIMIISVAEGWWTLKTRLSLKKESFV